MSIVLNEKFWSEFVKKNWEKKPILIKDFTASIQNIDSAEIFDWLVKYSDHCRKIKKAVGFKFYIDGESQYQNEVLQALPVKQDKSLQGYHARMNKIFSDYCLVCDELMQVSGSQQIALRNLMHSLYDRVGIPNRKTEIGLYLGNYKKTPFGVHVDGCGVFSFPVEGVKKFRLWTDNYVRKNPDLEMAFDYPKHIKKSSLMTAQKGDLAYWPSKAWHIAESNGEFSATWSLGVWVDQPYIQVLSDTLLPLLAKKLKNGAQAKSIRAEKVMARQSQIKKLPPVLQHSVDMLSALTKKELHDLIMQQWLKVNSQNGFRSSIKPDLNLKLKMTENVVVAAENPVLWSLLKDGKLCIAVHGMILTLPKTKSSLTFIQQLNSGKAFKVESILKPIANRGVYKKILETLFQTRHLVLASKVKQ